MGEAGNGGRPWTKRSVAARTVPTALAVVCALAVGLGATVAGRDEPTAAFTGPAPAEVRGYADLPTLPVTYEDARVAGTLDQYDWGERCDSTRQYNDTGTTLARVAFPSTYAPPCVPVWDGSKPWRDQGGSVHQSNGGSTARGVTAETIKVVFYLPAELDVAKQLDQFGIADGAETTFREAKRLVEMSNQLYETYGRRVELVPFHATGDGRSPSAAKADAVRVVEMGAFASIGGPTQSSSYQHELARHGVLCIQCGYAATDDVFAQDAPYAWGYLASPDQLLGGLTGGGSDVLWDRKAKFAGDPKIRARSRVFGIVHYEQDPPVFSALKARTLKEFEAKGRDAGVTISYLLDPNNLNAQAQAIIGRLVREGVTTVVFLGDPLMPRVLMQQASKQNYFPEWVFTGTVFTDTTVIGRLYDQRQMAHTYGISSSPARTEPEVSEQWRLYRWWYGTAPESPKTLLFWGPVVQQLFLGIHMAGPDLRADTFAGGLFNYPPTGGTNSAGLSGTDLFLKGYLDGDTTPAISFGFHNNNEAADYVAVDDFTFAWWSATDVGPDESGTVGREMWMALGLGLRQMLSNPSTPQGVSEDFLFSRTLAEAGGPLAEAAAGFGLADLPISKAILDKTPRLNELPDYPRWPESPAGE